MSYIGKTSDNAKFVLDLGIRNKSFGDELKGDVSSALTKHGIALTEDEVRYVQQEVSPRSSEQNLKS